MSPLCGQKPEVERTHHSLSLPGLPPPDTQVQAGLWSRMGTQYEFGAQPDSVHSQGWGSARPGVQFGVGVQFRVQTSAWHRGSARVRVRPGPGLRASVLSLLLQYLPPPQDPWLGCRRKRCQQLSVLPVVPRTREGVGKPPRWGLTPTSSFICTSSRALATRSRCLLADSTWLQ